MPRLKPPLKSGRRPRGTTAITNKIMMIEENTRNMGVLYGKSDLGSAFILKRQTEDTFEKVMRLCGGLFRGNPACKRLGPVIKKFRKEATRFNRCKCPKPRKR